MKRPRLDSKYTYKCFQRPVKATQLQNCVFDFETRIEGACMYLLYQSNWSPPVPFKLQVEL